MRLGVLILLVYTARAFAGDISLPLDGYYRVGRYMPVRFQVAPNDLRWSADGAMTTLIHNPVGGVAPFLVVHSGAHDFPFPVPLHELAPDDRLVGFMLGAPNVAADLFPGLTIIQIPLDGSQPLLSPPAAWQTLDAVVLDSASAARLSLDTKSALLAGGTTLIAGTAHPPDNVLPWHLENGVWIVRSRPPPILADNAFQPIAGWSPGRSATDRRQTVVFAGVFAVLLLLISLWPSRWAAWSAVGLAAGTILFVHLWDANQSGVSTAEGQVQISGRLPLLDTWVFQRASKTTTVQMPFWAQENPMLPIHGGPKDLTLICDSIGNPINFEYRLETDHAAAFVFCRITSVPVSASLSATITSPLRFLMPEAYGGMTLLGEIPNANSDGDDPVQWPSLVLANSDAIPKNSGLSNGRSSSNR